MAGKGKLKPTDPGFRSWNLAQVRSKDTKPEWIVRRLLYHHGYRYRLHIRDLPGCPDLVFPSKKKVIMVHGCFWHGHTCKNASIPKTNSDFWTQKLRQNVERDNRNIIKLNALGWEILVIWECELKDDYLIDRLKKFLN